MSKALINQDAAYALGEEAFRAGFKAAWGYFTSYEGEMPKAANIAWDIYEPSEDVKALIDDEKPLCFRTSSGDTIQISYDAESKMAFIREIK